MATDIIARGMAAEAEKTANKYKAGTNIIFTENADGTVAIEASGEVSSEDTVARNLINNHKENTDNPHGVTAEQIGLGNVDNTSDLEKPISNAMQDALDKKVDSSNLGAAAYKDVPADGNASDSQVVLGNDSRLSDSRKADGGNADTLDGLHASELEIDIITDAAESVTLDGLQGGVPFSNIVLNGDIVGQDVTLTACGKNLADLSGVDGKLISGISFAYDNGNVVLNGTATAQIYVGIKMHLSAGTYTASGSTDKNARVVLRDKSYRNIADSASPVATVTIVSDDYYVHIAIAAGTVCDNAVIKPQLERGAVATEYEPYSGSVTTITPDSNPYTVPNDIRQQEGINNVSVSAGEVSVTGVKRNAAVKRIWAKLDELTAAIIVSNGETTE